MAESSNMATPQVQTQPAAPSTGSSTMQIRPQPVLRLSAPSGTLRLRAVPAEERHIQWAEDVVDNEGMGKKSSKVCCIYHKPRPIDESSDESSSDSSDSSDSDSDIDDGSARPSGSRKGGNPRGRQHDHDGDEHDGCDHDHDQGEGSAKPQKRTRPRRKPSPNAYEKMPKQKK